MLCFKPIRMYSTDLGYLENWSCEVIRRPRQRPPSSARCGPEPVTPHAEAWQAVVWHLIVSHPVRGLGQGSRSERTPGSLERVFAGGIEIRSLTWLFMEGRGSDDQRGGHAAGA